MIYSLGGKQFDMRVSHPKFIDIAYKVGVFRPPPSATKIPSRPHIYSPPLHHTSSTGYKAEVLVHSAAANESKMSTSSATGLPKGWEVRHSNSKNLPYYHHIQTRESIWEPPAGTDLDLLQSHMSSRSSTTSQPPLSSTTVPAPPSSSSEPAQIRVAHLLIKHSSSRNPKSWKSPEGISRSKSEALEVLERHLSSIRAGDATLRGIAQTESDCSSHSRGGDLGFFGRRQMQRPFEDASFALKPGEVSGVVETDSGVHVIERSVRAWCCCLGCCAMD